MADRPPVGLPSGRRALLVIVVYYVIGAAVALLLSARFPSVQSAFTMGRLSELTSAGLIGGAAVGEAVPGIDSLAVVVVSIVGALAIMLPVAWTYILIKRQRDYDESIVHTLVILPVAVTGIVIIVQNSLALAFSLAGIVAAVRFRTTLKDTKDAVYVFLAIGVGLSAGVQALGVAAVLSIAFNAINIALWTTNFGNIYADRAGRTGNLSLGDVLAGPASADSALSFGDPRLLKTLSRRELAEAAERMARMQRHLRSETTDQQEHKAYSVLMVYALKAGEAQKVTERLLKSMAHRWRLAEIIPAEEGVSILEYLVRMGERHSTGELLDVIREQAGPYIKAAELRSLEGLRK